MRIGGFSEPLFGRTDAARERWQNQYFSDLVREDILEFSRIHEVKAMHDLLELFRARTGSPLSYDSLSRELSVAPNTVKNYVQILEALHIAFLMKPFHRNVARAMAKAPKLNFYDWAYVKDPQSSDLMSGARSENLVACHFLKQVQFLNDAKSELLELHDLGTTSGKEIDFVLAKENGDATHFIDVKLSDETPSYGLRENSENYPAALSIQLVLNAKHSYQRDKVAVVVAVPWLAKLAA